MRNACEIWRRFRAHNLNGYGGSRCQKVRSATISEAPHHPSSTRLSRYSLNVSRRHHSSSRTRFRTGFLRSLLRGSSRCRASLVAGCRAPRRSLRWHDPPLQRCQAHAACNPGQTTRPTRSATNVFPSAHLPRSPHVRHRPRRMPSSTQHHGFDWHQIQIGPPRRLGI